MKIYPFLLAYFHHYLAGLSVEIPASSGGRESTGLRIGLLGS